MNDNVQVKRGRVIVSYRNQNRVLFKGNDAARDKEGTEAERDENAQEDQVKQCSGVGATEKLNKRERGEGE
eukprot:3009684-Pleurochrysis_carterae.AAC.12